MENKDWTEEDLKKYLDELEKESDFKWPIYHGDGLVTATGKIGDREFVCVMRADAFDKMVGEAMCDLVHNPEKKHLPFKMDKFDKNNLPRKKKKKYKKFIKRHTR